jgi:hypothetical protein
MSSHKKAEKNGLKDASPEDRAVSPDEPAIEEIQARAYESYVQRGRLDGFDLEDWLQAEKELKQRRNKPAD